MFSSGGNSTNVHMLCFVRNSNSEHIDASHAAQSGLFMASLYFGWSESVPMDALKPWKSGARVYLAKQRTAGWGGKGVSSAGYNDTDGGDVSGGSVEMSECRLSNASMFAWPVNRNPWGCVVGIVEDVDEELLDADVSDSRIGMIRLVLTNGDCSCWCARETVPLKMTSPDTEIQPVLLSHSHAALELEPNKYWSLRGWRYFWGYSSIIDNAEEAKWLQLSDIKCRMMSRWKRCENIMWWFKIKCLWRSVVDLNATIHSQFYPER